MNQNIVKPRNKTSIKKAKGGFFSIFLFYFFVAFEFAYMAGPFAIYFYSIYSPVLNFFNKIPALSWLVKFFLPHVVRETASPVITIITIIGIILSLVGFLIFIIGACQIYYSKLTKKGAVTGGLYKYIRHPQYTSFIVCSFGLLLLWPRYIVVIFFVLLLFGYYFLARAEEKECEAKYGESFIEYEQQTGRFFPKFNKTHLSKTSSQKDNILHILVAFICTLIVFLGGALALNQLTIHSLYSSLKENSATISLSTLTETEIEEILTIAKENTDVQHFLANKAISQAELNYVMPTEWFAAEVPMNGIEYRKGHKSPQNYNPNFYKIIFLGATVPEIINPSGVEILTKTNKTTPLVEVWVDLASKRVTDIKEMPDNIKYNGIPEAIY